jgi:hypothetical protein
MRPMRGAAGATVQVRLTIQGHHCLDGDGDNMKSLCALLLGAALLIPIPGGAATNASLNLTCYSLQVQRGSEPNAYFYLDLSSSVGGRDGELALDFFGSGYTHSSYLTLQDELCGDTLSGQLGLNVPSGGDANKDGFPDFFQVSQGITNLTSSGAFALQGYGSGSVKATWNRAAGSSFGNCMLSMQLMPPQTTTFSHTFQVIEYTGLLSYTPGTNRVSGNVQLVQTDNTAAMMTGAVLFVKTVTNHFNALTLQPGVWTNDSQQAVFYLNDIYLRDPRWPTNYYGYLEMTDPSNPGAFYPYGTWLLSINDTNDSNHDGVPDFSDDPAGPPPLSNPQLELTQNGSDLVFTIHGGAGHTNDIQTITDLGTGNWQTIASVTATNDAQTISLPRSGAMASFWRIRRR